MSKQPIFKVTAVRVSKVADSAGHAAPAPTTAAAAPVGADGFAATDGSVPATVGGPDAEASSELREVGR